MKTFRLRVKIAKGEPRIFRVKAESLESAKYKLSKSIEIDEMLSDDEVEQYTKVLDDINELFKTYKP